MSGGTPVERHDKEGLRATIADGQLKSGWLEIWPYSTGHFSPDAAFDGSTIAIEVSYDESEGVGDTALACPVEGNESAAETVGAGQVKSLPVKAGCFKYIRFVSSDAQSGADCVIRVRLKA